MKMKILLLSILSTIIFAFDITFNVNMSEQDITPGEGPTLWMGHLYPDPGFVMTDEDSDGIWSYTIALEQGIYLYKFRNGWWQDWNTGDGWEDITGQGCGVGAYNDRQVVIDGVEDIDLDTVCFGSCTEECVEPSEEYNATFQVDMNNQDLSESDIVYLQGTFNGWCGFCNPMSDLDGDGIWELTIGLPIGEHEYLFTTNGWDGLQGGAPI